MRGPSIPRPVTPPPPPMPLLSPMVRYAPLFNYIEHFSGKQLSDDDKVAVITLANAGTKNPK